MVGLLLVGASAVSTTVRHTAMDGDTRWPVVEGVVQILGCALVLAGLALMYRASRRTEEPTAHR